MAGAKFLALDYGAGSGRAMLAQVDQTITLQELHRFYNPQIKMLKHYYWDLPYLYNELKKGLAAAGRQGHRDLSAIGVDTWGVDFGLIGKRHLFLANPITYRDNRTEGMMAEAFKVMPQEDIYRHTGIQFMSFNTIYQLLSMVREQNPLLTAAQRLLFMPDLFNYLMTGELTCEYSIASTSQLLNARTRQWEFSLIKKLGIPDHLFLPVTEPGTVIGPLLPELSAECELPAIDVIASASHDTASAVAAVPATGSNWAYLSSGTWSLIGIEIKEPIINDNSFAAGFTNEGGVQNTIRFLRNVMGMWLFEQCRAKWEKEGLQTYEQLIAMAQTARPFIAVINPDDSRFLNPTDMPAAILSFCRDTGQTSPVDKGEMIRTIFEGLALKYRHVLEQIQKMQKIKLDVLHIVGGGSQNDLLNQFTANATGLTIIAGPVEATALGNVIVQAMAKKVIGSLQEGRELITRSFPLKIFEPQEAALWHEKYQAHKDIFAQSTF